MTVDLTGTDDRPDLVGVWNTFANSRGYVMTQVVAAMDPGINKNEGFFNAVDMVIPEGCIAHPPPNKPAALGSFHPACEITEAVCVALSAIVPERSAPQVYKMGMPNAVIGFDEHGQMWMDQGVDSRTCDSSAVQGIDGWGACPVSLGNLLLAQVEDAESRFPIINISREMTQDSDGAGRWRGQPGSLNVKQVLEPTTAMAWMVTAQAPPARDVRRRRRQSLFKPVQGRHAGGAQGGALGQRDPAPGLRYRLPVRRRRRLRAAAAARPGGGEGRRARRNSEYTARPGHLRCGLLPARSRNSISRSMSPQPRPWRQRRLSTGVD